MSCKLTSSISKKNCQYAVAGIKAIYLYNYDSPLDYEFKEQEPGLEKITITKIPLEKGQVYKVNFADNTASFSDELAQNGNGGKYRTHTLNFTIDAYDYELLNQDKALSLGKFTAVVIDKNGRSIVLGRNNGLSATSFNYASGAAEADATGWTVVMAGTEIEMGRMLESEDIIKSLVADADAPVVVTP